MKRSAATLVTLLASLLFNAAPAAADGCFVWTNRDIDITEPEQKAVLVFDRGWEDLILEVKYEGPAPEFGWVVPLPSKPEMSPAKARLFEDLSMLTQERHFGMSWRGWGGAGGLASAVKLLEQKRVGIYDTTVLSSDNGEALGEWLRNNKFDLPRNAGRILDEYTRRHWVFVTMKIAPGEADTAADRKLASGTIQPIRFRFRSPEPVFPLRISSINGGASDVLLYVLADDQYVNRTCRRGDWETRMCGPHKLEDIDPDSVHAADGRPTFFVSKLRAHLTADQMEDVLFSPYDPFPALKNSNLDLRAEAASYIGWKRISGGVEPLAELLDRAKRGEVKKFGMPTPESQDAISAAWALGQIGSEEAISCLLKVAADSSSRVSLEALNSLAQLKVREALPLFISRLRPVSTFRNEAIHQLALETIVEQGDSSCLAGLRLLGPPPAAEIFNNPASPYMTWDPRNDGPAVMAALAACGDTASRKMIVDAIIAGSKVTTPTELFSDAIRGGSYNNFPSGVWIGTALIVDRYPTTSRWTALARCLWLLRQRPVLVDSLLRRAASDPRVPDPGRALLLGCLNKPDNRDRALLDQVWIRAMMPGAILAPVQVGESRDRRIEYFNLSACPVVYAFMKWKDAASLRHLWDDFPQADNTTRADIALGLAKCGHPEDMERIAAYIARDWNRTAAGLDVGRLTQEYEQRVRAEPYPVYRDWDWELRDRLDAEYRIYPVFQYFRRTAGSSSVVERFISDTRLHPLLRLRWILFGVSEMSSSESVMAAARQALDELEPEYHSDPLAVLIKEARRRMDLHFTRKPDIK